MELYSYGALRLTVSVSDEARKMQELVVEGFNQLDPQAQQILELRFGQNKTLDEVAKILGFNPKYRYRARSRVRQLERRAIMKIAKHCREAQKED